MKRCPECGKPYDDDLTYCPDDGYMLVPETGGDDDPYLGAVFENRYRVVKRVGEGGMGSVYLARNINAEMDVTEAILDERLAEVRSDLAAINDGAAALAEGALEDNQSALAGSASDNARVMELVKEE